MALPRTNSWLVAPSLYPLALEGFGFPVTNWLANANPNAHKTYSRALSLGLSELVMWYKIMFKRERKARESEAVSGRRSSFAKTSFYPHGNDKYAARS